MEDNLKRKENESYINYSKRITQNKKELDIDYLEWQELLLGEKIYASENCRKAYYILDKWFKRLDTENEQKYIETNIGNEDALTALEIEKIELQKERKKLQTINLEYNRMIREQARIEMYFEQVDEAIKNAKPIIVPKTKIDYDYNGINMITGFADAHYAKEINLKGLLGEDINVYNVEKFEKRMWQLLSDIVRIANKEQQKHITFLNLSDSLDGILRMSQLASISMGHVQATMDFSDFMVRFLNELSNYVSIDYYANMGNHNIQRILSNKKDFPHENTELIINHYLKGMLKDNLNITIHDCKPLQYINVSGMNILTAHGDEEKNLNSSIKDYTSIYGQSIDMMISGHKHSGTERTVGVNKDKNVEIIEFPSICGFDDYSISLKKVSNAGSKAIFVREGYGKEQVYDINLQV